MGQQKPEMCQQPRQQPGMGQVCRLNDGDEVEFTQIRRLDPHGRTEYFFFSQLDWRAFFYFNCLIVRTGAVAPPIVPRKMCFPCARKNKL